MSGFAGRYGPWALVAGASEGIGAAFTAELVRRGLAVVAVARRDGPLAQLAARFPGVRPVSADLGTPAGLDAVRAATAGLDVGLVVANAAYSPIGPLLAAGPEALTRAVDLNCRAPLLLAREYLPAMAARAGAAW